MGTLKLLGFYSCSLFILACGGAQSKKPLQPKIIEHQEACNQTRLNEISLSMKDLLKDEGLPGVDAIAKGFAAVNDGTELRCLE